MTKLELLASYLDGEATEFEKKAGQKFFEENLEFWQLCLEAKRLLIDISLSKAEKNDTDK